MLYLLPKNLTYDGDFERFNAYYEK
jgi:ABC-type multidrug transport system fused ATPase/permease subunit